MSNFYKESKVQYSAEQMYALVNDVDAYPDFLLWCRHIEVYEQSEQSLNAAVEIAFSGIHYRFITTNKMQLNEWIKMNFVEGPFKVLEGQWRFKEQADGCLVSLEMDFEFENKFVQYTISKAFNIIIYSLAESFIQRAKFIYG